MKDETVKTEVKPVETKQTTKVEPKKVEVKKDDDARFATATKLSQDLVDYGTLILIKRKLKIKENIDRVDADLQIIADRILAEAKEL